MSVPWCSRCFVYDPSFKRTDDSISNQLIYTSVFFADSPQTPSCVLVVNCYAEQLISSTKLVWNLFTHRKKLPSVSLINIFVLIVYTPVIKVCLFIAMCKEGVWIARSFARTENERADQFPLVVFLLTCFVVVYPPVSTQLTRAEFLHTGSPTRCHGFCLVLNLVQLDTMHRWKFPEFQGLCQDK